MLRKRAYRASSVKSLNLAAMAQELPGAGERVWVGLDIAKEEVLAVVRDEAGKFLRPWKVKQPGEIGELVARLRELAEGRTLVVAMESTGTYGDALRQALTDAQLATHRVSSKAVSDYGEIFDGVPSAHDGKDAAVIAELASIGKSTPWPYRPPSAAAGELTNEVHWLDAQQDIFQLWLGRLEGLLARHWPEGTGNLKLSSPTLLRALAEYGGPKALAEDPQAAQRLAAWGGCFLSAKKIAATVASARDTVGVRMTDQDQVWLKRCAAEAIKAHAESGQVRTRLAKLGRGDASLRRQAEVVGAVTAAVLQSAVGKPEDYYCGAAYAKAMGLNLKERSSGKYRGKIKITKRGPSLARRWLYFAALRIAQRPPVRGWFEAKKKRDQDRGRGALIAVMRRLALAIWSVATRGEPFQLERLFPGRPWKTRPCADSAVLVRGDVGAEATLGFNALGLQSEEEEDLREEEKGERPLQAARPLASESLGRRSGRFPPEPYPPPRSEKFST